MTEKTNREIELEGKLFDEAETRSDGQFDGSITVKYNGEEIRLSPEEAVVLAQKGMNYDHVVAERDSKYKRELDVLERFAALSGMSRDEYVRRLEAEEMDAEGEELVRLQRLYDAFPELRDAELPEEVSVSIREGADPVDAYKTHRIKTLERELEDVSRRKRAVGSVTGAASDIVRDEFMAGFMHR